MHHWFSCEDGVVKTLGAQGVNSTNIMISRNSAWYVSMDDIAMDRLIAMSTSRYLRNQLLQITRTRPRYEDILAQYLIDSVKSFYEFHLLHSSEGDLDVFRKEFSSYAPDCIPEHCKIWPGIKVRV